MTGDTVDFLMSQKNGAQYVVLYQMMCIMCINTKGEMYRQVGEMIIPFDIDKIQRDCKYFSRDTVTIALTLFKKLGLIYEEESGNLVIAGFGDLIGSESDYAKQKREQRKDVLGCGQNLGIGMDIAMDSSVDNDADKGADNNADMDMDTGVDNVHKYVSEVSTQSKSIEKEIEIRDKSIEKESDTYMTVSGETVRQTDVRHVLEAWNSLQAYGIKPVIKINGESRRYKSLMARIRQYGADKVVMAVNRIRQSDFLQGKNKNGWMVTFDWFVLPNNFPKVLEGNYDNNTNGQGYQGETRQMLEQSYSMMDKWAQERMGDGH